MLWSNALLMKIAQTVPDGAAPDLLLLEPSRRTSKAPRGFATGYDYFS
jgi:hypothetical protein